MDCLRCRNFWYWYIKNDDYWRYSSRKLNLTLKFWLRHYFQYVITTTVENLFLAAFRKLARWSFMKVNLTNKIHAAVQKLVSISNLWKYFQNFEIWRKLSHFTKGIRSLDQLVNWTFICILTSAYFGNPWTLLSQSQARCSNVLFSSILTKNWTYGTFEISSNETFESSWHF